MKYNNNNYLNNNNKKKENNHLKAVLYLLNLDSISPDVRKDTGDLNDSNASPKATI
jgi:hypothetical protein